MAALTENKIDIKAGVIEGFFGNPWDWDARSSGAAFLRDCGYDEDEIGRLLAASAARQAD